MLPGTPQYNGVSKRHNHTLSDIVQSMMSLTDLPLLFWGYALETSAYTLNRAPSKSVETTQYELWFSKKPKLSFLKVWGCDAYVKKFQTDKLEPMRAGPLLLPSFIYGGEGHPIDTQVDSCLSRVRCPPPQISTLIIS